MIGQKVIYFEVEHEERFYRFIVENTEEMAQKIALHIVQKDTPIIDKYGYATVNQEHPTMVGKEEDFMGYNIDNKYEIKFDEQEFSIGITDAIARYSKEFEQMLKAKKLDTPSLVQPESVSDLTSEIQKQLSQQIESSSKKTPHSVVDKVYEKEEGRFDLQKQFEENVKETKRQRNAYSPTSKIDKILMNQEEILERLDKIDTALYDIPQTISEKEKIHELPLKIKQHR